MLLDINLLRPSKIEFVQDPAPPLTLPDGASTPQMVGVYLQDSTPYPVLATYKIG